MNTLIPSLSGGVGVDNSTAPFLVVPQVSLPESFVSDGWKTIGVGRCALIVGGKGSTGYILQGTAEGPSVNFSLLLASNQDLFVDVPQTDFTLDPSNWERSDRLEIVTNGVPNGDGGAIVLLGNGTVSGKWDAKDLQPTVEMARKTIDGKPGTGYRIHFPSPLLPSPGAPLGMTLTYHRIEKGAPETIVATSQFAKGNTETLSFVINVPPSAAVCRPENGQLIVDRDAPWDPNLPLVESYFKAVP